MRSHVALTERTVLLDAALHYQCKAAKVCQGSFAQYQVVIRADMLHPATTYYWHCEAFVFLFFLFLFFDRHPSLLVATLIDSLLTLYRT